MNSQPTVLIVEDTEPCAETLEIALAQIAGVSVRVALTGKEALLLLDGLCPSICALVTDLHMPRVNGDSLINYVRGQTRHARLPIIVVSGDCDPQTPARVMRQGADAFFTKPYSPAAVRQRLEELLHERIRGPVAP